MIPNHFAFAVGAALLLLLSSCAWAAPVDPCAGLLPESKDDNSLPRTHGSAAQLLACVRAVPFNRTAALPTLEALRRSLPLYGFRDVAKAPADMRHFRAVDLDAQLAAVAERVEQGAYSSYYDFHMDLRSMFVPLYDAHAQYVVPQCLRWTIFVRPLALYSFTDDLGTAQVAIADPQMLLRRLAQADDFGLNETDIYANTLGKDVGKWSKYADAIVQSIDGQEPAAFLQQYADKHVGLVKAPETRLSLNFVQFLSDHVTIGAFALRSSALPLFGGPPTLEEVEQPVRLTVVRRGQTTPENVDVPLVPFAVPIPINSTKDLTNFCNGIFSEPLAQQESNKRFEGTILDDNVALRRPFDQVRERSKVQSPPGFHLILESKQLFCWVGRNDKQERMLVMFVPTFMVNDIDWGADAAKCFAVADRFGAKTLLLDMSENGGGLTCLGKALLSVLHLRHHKNGDLEPLITNMPMSDLASAMFRGLNASEQTTTWTPSSLEYSLGPKVHQACNDATLSCFFPPRPAKRGGVSNEWTDYLHLSEAACTLPPGYVPKSNVTFENIRIVTRGLCGSTCAEFVQHAQLYHNIPVTVLAPMSNHTDRIMSVSFPGLQVMAQSSINYVARNFAEAPDELIPPDSDAEWTWCVRPIYAPDDLVNPLEYRWLEPDRIVRLNQKEAQIFGSYWLK